MPQTRQVNAVSDDPIMRVQTLLAAASCELALAAREAELVREPA